MSRARTASSSSGVHETQLIGNILTEDGEEVERQEFPRGESIKDPIGHRSTSAPPQLAFLDSVASQRGGETIHADDLRRTPEYYTYYYSQRPLDPRLPPPVFDPYAYYANSRARVGAPGLSEKDFLFRAGLKVGDLATLTKSEKSGDAPDSSTSGQDAPPPIMSATAIEQELLAKARAAQLYSSISSSPSTSPPLFSRPEYGDGDLSQRFGALNVSGSTEREVYGDSNPSTPFTVSLSQISGTQMPQYALPISSAPPAPSSSSSSSASTSLGSMGGTLPNLILGPSVFPMQYPSGMQGMPFSTIGGPLGGLGVGQVGQVGRQTQGGPPSGTGGSPMGPTPLPQHFQPPFRNLGPNPSPMLAVMGFGHLGQGPSRFGAPPETPISPALASSLAPINLTERRPGPPSGSPPMGPSPLAGPPLGVNGGMSQDFRGPPPFGDGGGFGRGRPMWGDQRFEQQSFRGGSKSPRGGGRGSYRGKSGGPFERKEGGGRRSQQQYGSGFSSGGPPAQAPSSGLDSTRSAWLDDFRLNKANSSLTLKDVVSRGLMLELATDQYGSRFIQQKLESASTDEKQAAFEQLLPETLRLCTDVFGNYVIQKFFEFGIFEHKKILASKLVGNVLMLSLQMYGCRVVQKALDVSDVETQALLVRELTGHVMECVKDQNGNHVIQKCIEKVPPYLIQFIVEAFSHQIFNLSTHPYGCRVIQRLLENCSEEQRNAILAEILENVEDLCKNQYGNYVIQHVLIHGTPFHRGAIIRAVRGKVLPLSKHKFASNVIEKCFAHASRQHRALLVEEVLGKEDRDPSKSPLISMVKDQYANYVIQKMVDVVDEEQRAMILHRIKRHVPNLRKIPYGKHIIARIEKLTGKPILA